MVTEAEQRHQAVRGGGTLPIPTGQLHLTWPFVVMKADESGITVKAFPRLLVTKLLGKVGSADPPGPAWSCAWNELDRVLVAPRKLVVYPREGRGCRFVTIRRGQLHRLLEAISKHGVSCEQISRFSRAGFSL